MDGLRWLNLPEFVADDPRRPGRARDVPRPRAPGCSTRTPAHRGPRCSPRSASPRTSCRPSCTAGADLGRIADGHPSRAPCSPSRATTTSSRPRPTARSRPTRYHVSMGTAEVLLRVIDAPLGYAARARLAEHLINEVRHVVPGKHVLVAGLKTGLAAASHPADAGDHATATAATGSTPPSLAIPYEGTLPVGRASRSPAPGTTTACSPSPSAPTTSARPRSSRAVAPPQQRRDRAAGRRHGPGGPAPRPRPRSRAAGPPWRACAGRARWSCPTCRCPTASQETAYGAAAHGCAPAAPRHPTHTDSGEEP